MATKSVYCDEKNGLAGVYLRTNEGLAIQLSAEDEGHGEKFAGSYLAIWPKDDPIPFTIAAPSAGGLQINYRGGDGEIRSLDLIKALEALARLVD